MDFNDNQGKLLTAMKFCSLLKRLRIELSTGAQIS